MSLDFTLWTCTPPAVASQAYRGGFLLRWILNYDEAREVESGEVPGPVLKRQPLVKYKTHVTLEGLTSPLGHSRAMQLISRAAKESGGVAVWTGPYYEIIGPGPSERWDE